LRLSRRTGGPGQHHGAAAAAAADQPLVGQPPVGLDDDTARDAQIVG